MARYSVYVHTPEGNLAFVGNINASDSRRAIRSAPMLRPSHPNPIIAHALPKTRTRVLFLACVPTVFSDLEPTP